MENLDCHKTLLQKCTEEKLFLAKGCMVFLLFNLKNKDSAKGVLFFLICYKFGGEKNVHTQTYLPI